LSKQFVGTRFAGTVFAITSTGNDSAENSGEQVDTRCWAVVYDGDVEELDASGVLKVKV